MEFMGGKLAFFVCLALLVGLVQMASGACPIHGPAGRRVLSSVKLEPKVPQYLEKPLKFDFYKKSCPQASGIVEKVVSKYSEIDPTNPAPLMRLFFHDCFVQGCDASVLLNSTTKIVAEKDASINFSLGDFNIIDEIKAELEHACPETVSCADVLALTAVHSIHQVSCN
jgi:hypothetical protein